jgi:hypothetical protein
MQSSEIKTGGSRILAPCRHHAIFLKATQDPRRRCRSPSYYREAVCKRAGSTGRLESNFVGGVINFHSDPGPIPWGFARWARVGVLKEGFLGR